MADRRTYEKRGIHSTSRAAEDANRAKLRARILELLAAPSGIECEELHGELRGRWPNGGMRRHALQLLVRDGLASFDKASKRWRLLVSAEAA